MMRDYAELLISDLWGEVDTEVRQTCLISTAELLSTRRVEATAGLNPTHDDVGPDIDLILSRLPR